MRIREIHIAVKRESKIPIPSIKPNHWINETPNKYRINADINEVMWESHIAVHECLNPIEIAFVRGSLSFSASCVLSKMSIFASIAKPIERITPAMEASVKTTPKNFTNAIRNNA